MMWSVLLGGVVPVAAPAVVLLYLRTKSDPTATDLGMAMRDYSLLVALVALVGLGGSGLIVLALRATSAFGIAFLMHLAWVATTMLLAPYSKFTHVVLRVLALVRDAAEQELATSGEARDTRATEV